MRFLFILLATVIFATACNDSKTSDNTDSDSPSDTGGGESDADSNVSSDTDLWPAAWSVLGARCGGPGSCHNMASGGESGVNLPSDDETMCKINATGASGSIRSAINSGQMPQGDTLSTEDRTKVIDWIDSL